IGSVVSDRHSFLNFWILSKSESLIGGFSMSSGEGDDDGDGGGTPAFARDSAPVDWRETDDAHIFQANLPS
ncbi:hypothetical protein U1Q18_017608, partial [Sarracenia purpurea var. burkii]